MITANAAAAASREGLLMPRCIALSPGDSDEHCVDPTDEQRQYGPMTQTRARRSLLRLRPGAGQEPDDRGFERSGDLALHARRAQQGGIRAVRHVAALD